jgi:hypothetical protein
MPPSQSGTKYPFGKMEVGDSFLTEASERQRVSSAANSYGKQHNCKFACRRTAEGGLRVWRVE